MFGNPETTTGGNALKFYASVRLDIRRTAAIKDGETHIGNRTKVKVVKNKVASPFKEAEFDIMYGQGISQVGDILDLAANNGIVEKAGSWFSYNNAKVGQGRENSKTFLEANPAMLEEIKQKILVKFGLAGAINTEFIDKSTGEIMDGEMEMEAEEKVAKKSKKNIQ
jgi:recombination protein RecA